MFLVQCGYWVINVCIICDDYLQDLIKEFHESIPTLTSVPCSAVLYERLTGFYIPCFFERKIQVKVFNPSPIFICQRILARFVDKYLLSSQYMTVEGRLLIPHHSASCSHETAKLIGTIKPLVLTLL